jgi:hypothetical protein
MRLEGQHRRGPVRLPGAVHRLADHRAVAAMHAVEVPDRHERPGQPRKGIAVADDAESVS